MKIIKGARASGKTINLIREASEKDLCIVCYDMHTVEMIAETARQMNLSIRLPITYNELIEKKYYGKGIKGFALEDLDLFLQELFKRKLEAMTLDADWDTRNETIECKPFGWLDEKKKEDKFFDTVAEELKTSKVLKEYVTDSEIDSIVKKLKEE